MLLRVYSAVFIVLLQGCAIHSQCDEEAVCTPECYPEIWDMDLCQFYSRLSLWRATVEGCSLSLPAPPTRDRSLPARAQWDQARGYWSTVLELWRREAEERGVPQQDSDTSSGSGDDNMMMMSGLGLLPDDPRPQSTEGAWIRLIAEWERDFTVWNTYVETQTGGDLPGGSGVSAGIAEFVSDGSAEGVRSNSMTWLDVAQDWSTTVNAFNTSYSEMCSN